MKMERYELSVQSFTHRSVRSSICLLGYTLVLASCTVLNIIDLVGKLVRELIEIIWKRMI